MAETPPELQAYLDQKINPILDELIESVYIIKPSDPVKYCLQWLRSKAGLYLSQSEKAEVSELRQELTRLKSGKASDEELETSDDSEDEYIDIDLITSSKKDINKSRSSVSAEVFGEWNKKQDFIPRVIPKTTEQRLSILSRLNKNFMFASLDDREKEIVIEDMEERDVNTGDIVIQQGHDGKELFVVASGKLECFKNIAGENRFLKFYEPGDAFGELALLYNAPRAASIKASTTCKLWVLDRECFNHIVKESSVRRRNQYEDLLQRVELLKTMDPYERSRLADAFRSVSFMEGEYVIREGEWGELFYIIEEGTAIATKTLTPGCAPKQVKNYSAGDYFGELALLRGEPRAANIVATSSFKCVSLDRYSFRRLLGPLEEILQRNAEIYSKVISMIS